MSDISLMTPEEDEEVSLLDLLQVVVENLRLLVLGASGAGLVGLAVAFAITPTFTATTRIMPPQQQASGAASLLQSLGALGGIAGAAGGIKNPNDQYVAFLRSRSLQDTLIERLKLTERYEEKFRSDTRTTLDTNVRVTAGKDGLITVEADDYSPAFAAELANAHVEELGALLKRLAVTEAQQRRVFFEKQLASAKDDLIKAEQALKATGISVDTLKSDPRSALEGVAHLKATITAQEIKLASMRGYLADTAPVFKQALNELAAMRAQLQSAQSQDITPDQKSSALTGKQPSGAGADYVQRYREFKYQETLFELFAKQYEIARVDEAREGAVIQVVDVAVAPDRKSKPKRPLIALLTLLAAAFILILFVFIRQAWRNVLSDPKTAGRVQAIHASLKRQKL